MSNYKLKNHTAVYDPVLDMYNIFDGCGGRMGTVALDLLIDFGWEKVEEPFKENEWLFIDSGGGYETIFRFKSFNGSSYSTSESYQVYDNFFGKGVSINGDSGDHFAGTSEPTYRATPEQVERILSIVARHKGYKPLVMIDGLGVLSSADFHYDEETDTLWGSTEVGAEICIYSGKIWAPIKEEPKAAEPQVEAGHEYLCIKDLARGTSRFTKGKRYLFKEHDGGMFETINDQGAEHVVDKDLMHKWFDMGTDWRTAKVFSYEDIESLLMSSLSDKILWLYRRDLEEEAKKRSNQ